MAFEDMAETQSAVALLQRSLERGRLGHAYLFVGPDLELLEAAASNLAKTLNCQAPPQRGTAGNALDCCEACLDCRKINDHNHPDVYWIRPESKSRVITIEQMRELMQTVNLKPTQAIWKVAVVVAADRLNPQAANAFLKTLEEPPGESILILLTTDPERLLETILSRCLRLNFAGETNPAADEALVAWLSDFTRQAASGPRTLLSRYRLLSVFLNRLNSLKTTIADTLTERSPLEQFEDIEPKLREKWEDELTAAIEAEYRHQRAQQLVGLQWWFRDVWLATADISPELFAYPELAEDAVEVAGRLAPREALANLRQLEQTQQLLATNVQEVLALEVGLLKLRL